MDAESTLTCDWSEYPHFDRLPYMSGNFIHPLAIVSKDAKIGTGNYIGPFCIIGAGVTIGNNNRFEGLCSIGTPPEHREYFTLEGKTIIGNRNTFREFVTINAGIKETVIGNDCIFLKSSHVGHDCKISDKVTLSCGVKVGGHSILLDGVNMGLNAVCHQFSVIGHYSMIGMGSVITRKQRIEPFMKYAGVPAKQIGINARMMTEELRAYEVQERFRKEYNTAYDA